MASIIEVNGQTATIGTDDGQILEVSLTDIKFDAPRAGDAVKVFQSADRIIVTKAEARGTQGAMSNDGSSGVNVYVSNTNQTGASDALVVGGGKVVSKTAYALFAILLGGLGVHKFYAGKVGMGLVYILFCWTFIPAVVGLVEGIIALTKPADANGRIIV